MNQNFTPYNKKQDLCSFNRQSKASTDSFLHPHVDKFFKVYHQNIRDFQNNANELISFLSPDFPHIIYLTEHHLRNSEVDCTFINYYNLGAKFCRNPLKNVGVFIFMQETLQFTT